MNRPTINGDGSTVVTYIYQREKKNVIFNANGGTGTMSNQEVYYGVSTILTSNIFEKTNYAFLSWNTKADGSGTTYDDGDSVTLENNITLYAQWGILTAKFKTGSEVNTMMKGLSGNYSDYNYTITGFERATLEEYNAVKDTLADWCNKVSTDDSDYPIYMWFDNGTIKYYSKATTLYFNEDSSNMFYFLTEITELDLSDFNTVNVTNMSQMFFRCYNLTSLNVSDFDTTNVTNMSNMFSGCSSLTSLDVSEFITNNVTNMSYMFNGCSELTTINVSEFITSNVTNMSYMFSDCWQLTDLDVSGFNTSKVTDMSWMFANCLNITDLNVNNFDTQIVNSMDYMFYNCIKLTILDLSNFDTRNVTYMRYMFNSASLLQTIYASDNFVANTYYTTFMFQNCNHLVGGNGTSVAASGVTDAPSYVRIDAEGLPGYFTRKE